MENNNLSWLFVCFIAIILASIAFTVMSMIKAVDPINTVFMIIHAIDLAAVIGAWVVEAKRK